MTEQEPFAVLLDGSSDDLYENAPCGYLSTLPDGTFVRVNATFLRMTGYTREELIGRRRFQSVLSPGDQIFYETHYGPLLRMQEGARELAVDVVHKDGNRVPALVTSIVVAGADGSKFVRTAVFEARQRREYEHELLRARRRAEESETRARELARALQQSFIPPLPPSIPGMEVGAAYRPAGSGDEVGGDFYDIFATAPGDWVVALGDVRGKGVAAARVTALARYTIRAAAMQSRRPEHVLETLNTALLRSEEERFCTVVYARVEHGSSPPVHLTVACAGHPLPILVTSKGAAAAIGEPGDLVGVLDAPEFAPVDVTLDGGEMLLFYTDGVTEARRDDELYGDDRLLSFAEAHAGASAAAFVDQLVAEVLQFQGGMARDDIAVVALRAAGLSGSP